MRSAEASLPEWLTRSSVYKKVPVGVRGRLDEAILLRPAECATLDQIAEKFELAERFGISGTALRSYARKLEQYVRPAAASQLMAGVLGCLPEGYQQRLLAGSQVLLLSRVVKSLSAEGGGELSVAELAKLASVLSAMGGRSRVPTAHSKSSRPPASGSKTIRGMHSSTSDEGEPDLSAATGNPTKLAEAVRMLYGLSWPPVEQHPK